jgi:hypothetical protein
MEVLMKTFYEPDEKGRMKITESRGSKKPIKLAQGFVKKVGEPISLRDATKALHIIKTTSGGNPLMEELRRKRLFKSNPIDVNM